MNRGGGRGEGVRLWGCGRRDGIVQVRLQNKNGDDLLDWTRDMSSMYTDGDHDVITSGCALCYPSV